MWIVVFITQSRETADKATEILRDFGFVVKVRNLGAKSDSLYGCFEILLPEAEVGAGHKALISKLF